MKNTDMLIDYLIGNGGCDTCGKCVNFIPWTEEDEKKVGAENLITCNAVNSPHTVPPIALCREGMKTWFEVHGDDRG